MKQKGTAFETEVLRHLESKGFLAAHRTATKGGQDTGDINGIVNVHSKRRVVVQCKNQRSFDLSGWLNATGEQASRLGGAVPVLTIKRPRIGPSNSGKHYAVLELDELIQLLLEAGYR